MAEDQHPMPNRVERFTGNRSENSSKDDRLTTVVTASSSKDDRLTVVTAYFDIGKFQKGNGGPEFKPELYRQWAKVFARLESPTIIFVGSKEYHRYFTELRSVHQLSNMTVVWQLDRQQMWAFRMEPAIAKIFSRPGYPYSTPNTVVAAYSAAMHAKYEVMQMAMHSNPFGTRYFCWLGIGLFRGEASSGVDGPRFSLSLPKNFDRDAVAYTEVYGRNPQKSVQNIIVGDMVWICGCFFLGRRDVLLAWVEEYKVATEKMLKDGWMSTDQQVIYSMFNTMKPKTRLQLYHADGRYNPWFHLGYLAREAGAKGAVTTKITSRTTSWLHTTVNSLKTTPPR